MDDDDADRMQARVLLSALDDEIEQVSGQLEDARRRADGTGMRGDVSFRSWHLVRVKELKDVLRELHRQTSALRARFEL